MSREYNAICIVFPHYNRGRTQAILLCGKKAKCFLSCLLSWEDNSAITPQPVRILLSERHSRPCRWYLIPFDYSMFRLFISVLFWITRRRSWNASLYTGNTPEDIFRACKSSLFKTRNIIASYCRRDYTRQQNLWRIYCEHSRLLTMRRWIFAKWTIPRSPPPYFACFRIFEWCHWFIIRDRAPWRE